MWAHVTTDGSCRTHSRSGELIGRRAPGGWAAIVEHGSDGWVCRGRAEDTTAVRMEMRAVIEGLRSLPDLIPARVHSDATQVYGVWERWRDGRIMSAQRSPDFDLHLELAEQFSRFTRVEVLYVGKRDHDPRHKRAHLIARAEAGALARGDDRELPLADPPAPRMREWFVERDPLAAQARRLQRRRVKRTGHTRACTPTFCAPNCQLGLQYNARGEVVAWRVA